MKEVLFFILKPFALIWVFACIPFRKYARNVVYNYVLQNYKRDWLKRLWERDPVPRLEKEYSGWDLLRFTNKDHGYLLDRDGFIEHRKVSTVKFWLVVIFIWGWLDDDSNQDTTDSGYCRELVTGTVWQGGRDTGVKLKHWRWHSIFKPFLKNIDFNGIVFGNAFDLGDNRPPFFNFWATLVWNWRNTSMNFKYLFNNY